MNVYRLSATAGEQYYFGALDFSQNYGETDWLLLDPFGRPVFGLLPVLRSSTILPPVTSVAVPSSM